MLAPARPFTPLLSVATLVLWTVLLTGGVLGLTLGWPEATTAHATPPLAAHPTLPWVDIAHHAPPAMPPPAVPSPPTEISSHSLAAAASQAPSFTASPQPASPVTPAQRSAFTTLPPPWTPVATGGAPAPALAAPMAAPAAFDAAAAGRRLAERRRLARTPAADTTVAENAGAAHAPTPQPLVFGQGDGRQPKPGYPVAAQRNGWEGTVEVRFAVDADGHVTRAKLLSGCKYDVLNAAALATIQDTWRFPAGEPRLYDVAICFKLTR